MFMTWKEKFSIDGDIIDSDHKHLIEIMDGVMTLISSNAPGNAVISMLEALKEFSRKHFEREESLQKACNFAEGAEHHQKHEKLIADLEAYIDGLSEIRHGNLAAEEIEKRLRDTKRFMTRWLIAHILGEDMKMKPYVIAMRGRAREMSPLGAMA